MKTNSKEFKALQADWYKKLNDDGFSDIEDLEGNLRTSANHNIENQQTLASFEHRQEYYRLAGFFYNDFSFKDDFKKKVWGMHAEGVAVREIAKALKEEGYPAHRDKVDKTIQTLRKLMIKKYGVTNG